MYGTISCPIELGNLQLQTVDRHQLLGIIECSIPDLDSTD